MLKLKQVDVTIGPVYNSVILLLSRHDNEVQYLKFSLYHRHVLTFCWLLAAVAIVSISSCGNSFVR